jgi:hypothetical protein
VLIAKTPIEAGDVITPFPARRCYFVAAACLGPRRQRVFAAILAIMVLVLLDPHAPVR